jgi:hypothetical protein
VHEDAHEVTPRFELARVVQCTGRPDDGPIGRGGNPSFRLEPRVIPVAVVDASRLFVVVGL